MARLLREGVDQIVSDVFDLDAVDPSGELVDRSGLSEGALAQINHLMSALGALRRAETRLMQESWRRMNLNETDMRALYFLIVSENRHQVATPGIMAEYLGISTASTTKLLDRLEQAGRIVRTPHPGDRRALVIEITSDTRREALATIGRQEARRVLAAARLTGGQRDVVIAFLEDMARELSVGDLPWPGGARAEGT